MDEPATGQGTTRRSGPDGIAGGSEIWLIGGYGDVGLKTAACLLRDTAADIVLGGRNGRTAAASAAKLSARVHGRQLDAAKDADLPETARIVVNFVEALPHKTAAAVVRRGGLYVDASADINYLAALAETIGSGPGLAVLNAGLAPGLTNVLARTIKSDYPQTRAIDIILEMGMGRHHGYAATVWTLRGLGADYRAKVNGVWQDMQPGEPRRNVRFVPDDKPVPAIGFGFSDQVSIARTLDVDTVLTFLAVDTPFITRVMQNIAGRSPGRLISRNADLVAGIMARLPELGRVGTRLAVEGFDAHNRRTARMTVVSGDQSEMTAVMLAAAVRGGLMADAKGVVDFDEIVSLDTAKKALTTAMPATHWSDQRY